MFKGRIFNGPYLYPADGDWHLHYSACLGSVHPLLAPASMLGHRGDITVVADQFKKRNHLPRW